MTNVKSKKKKYEGWSSSWLSSTWEECGGGGVRTLDFWWALDTCCVWPVIVSWRLDAGIHSVLQKSTAGTFSTYYINHAMIQRESTYRGIRSQEHKQQGKLLHAYLSVNISHLDFWRGAVHKYPLVKSMSSAWEAPSITPGSLPSDH